MSQFVLDQKLLPPRSAAAAKKALRQSGAAPPKHSAQSPDLTALAVAALGLRPYVVNVLAGDGVHTVADLIDKSAAYLLRCPNFGRVALREVEAQLAQLGLALQPSPPPLSPRDSGRIRHAPQQAIDTSDEPAEPPPSVSRPQPQALLLSRDDLREFYGISYSRTYLAKLIARGEFPAPLALGPHSYSRKAWRRDDIEAWINKLSEFQYADNSAA